MSFRGDITISVIYEVFESLWGCNLSVQRRYHSLRLRPFHLPLLAAKPHIIPLNPRIHHIRIALSDLLLWLWSRLEFRGAVAAAVRRGWVPAYRWSHLLQPSYHLIVLSCNLKHFLLTLDQVSLAWVVCVGQAISSESISLVAHLLITFFRAANGAQMKLLTVTSALWRIAIMIIIEKGRRRRFR